MSPAQRDKDRERKWGGGVLGWRKKEEVAFGGKESKRKRRDFGLRFLVLANCLWFYC